MKELGYRLTIRLLVLALLIPAAQSWAQNRAPIIDQIAKAYGLDSYDQVEAIRYTWNIDIPGLFKASHKWEWEPKTGKISFEGTDKDGKPVKVSYLSPSSTASLPTSKTWLSHPSSTTTTGLFSPSMPTGTRAPP